MIDQVGGRGAVSSTVANTKQSVIQLQRRGADLLSRSERGGVSDFSQSSAGRGVSSGSKLDRLRRAGRKSKSPGDDTSVHQEPAGDGNTGDALSASSDGSTAGSQPVFSRAYGGPSLPIDGQEPNEPEENAERPDEDEQKEEGKTMAGKIGAFLSGLPLSKLKIVIGESNL